MNTIPTIDSYYLLSANYMLWSLYFISLIPVCMYNVGTLVTPVFISEKKNEVRENNTEKKLNILLSR